MTRTIPATAADVKRHAARESADRLIAYTDARNTLYGGHRCADACHYVWSGTPGNPALLCSVLADAARIVAAGPR